MSADLWVWIQPHCPKCEKIGPERDVADLHAAQAHRTKISPCRWISARRRARRWLEDHLRDDCPETREADP